MRPIRKNFLKTAGIINIISAILGAVMFIYLIFDFQGAKDMLITYLETRAIRYSITIQSLVNIFLIVLFAGTIANAVFGYIYLKYSKRTYLDFLKSKRSLTIAVIINLILSITYIAAPFAMIALLLKPSEEELLMVSNELMQIPYIVNKEEVQKEAKFIAMSLKIKQLKQRFSKNEITEKEYYQTLNDILTTGV